MTADLEKQLGQLKVGDHLCLVYERPEQILPVAARFLKDGLDRGEHAMYIVDDHSLTQVVDALERIGVDVARERERGTIHFLDAREYCPLEVFEPQQMLARFRELGDQMAAAGIPAVRAAVEMTWALTVGAPLDRLAEYECWGNHIFEHFTGISLCMYNRARFPAASMERLLRAHPIVVIGDLDRVADDRREREQAEARRIAEGLHEEKTRFLAVMSHELRTPLNAIIGYADLLRAGIPEPIGEAPLDHVERIRASARHLRRLIDEVLSFSRIHAGQEALEIAWTDVALLVQNASELLHPLANARSLLLRVQLPDEPLKIDTDAGKLTQILLNLMANAIRFTSSGYVQLTVRVENELIYFDVSDTGIGIAPEHLELIFEPFRQADGGRTRRVDGAGLGLSISREFARMLGGDVTVRSTVGEGSTFTVVLPALSVRAATSLPQPQTT